MSKKKEPVEVDPADAFVEDIGDGSYRVTIGRAIKTEDGTVDTLICHPLTMAVMKKLSKLGDDPPDYDVNELLVSNSCGLTASQFESLTPVGCKRLSGAIVKYFLAPE